MDECMTVFSEEYEEMLANDRELKKRTWAEIDLDGIRRNYLAIRSSLPGRTKFLGVVKADAYGHGALPVARLLQKEGANYLAVSCLDEALELRDAGITMPILILGHTPSRFTRTLIDNDITQTVTCLAKARAYSKEASYMGKTLNIHIALDTGMSRLGFLVCGAMEDDGIQHVAESCKMPGLHPEGIFTHFAVSDEDGEDNRAYTKRQFDTFMHTIQRLQDEHGITFEIRHCANTGAVTRYPEMALDMVRPGLLLYGYGPDADRIGVRPCMRLVSTISTIKHYEPGTDVSYGRRFTTQRHTRMGVLGIGYADGLPRAASGKCSFYAFGKEIPQCGSVCMDMCMVDLTDVPEAAIGSEIEIFGPHADVNLLAQAAGTISYELLCSVTKRVPRVYE